MSKFIIFLKKKWKEITAIVICLVVIIVTTTLYTVSATEHIFQESSKHLEEIATQVNEKFQVVVNNNKNMLDAWKHYVNDAADKIQTNDTSKAAELKQFFEAENSVQDLTNILFVGTKETPVDENGNPIIDGRVASGYEVVCKSGLDNAEVTLIFERSLFDPNNGMFVLGKNGAVAIKKATGEQRTIFLVDYRDPEREEWSHTHQFIYNDFEYRALAVTYDTEKMVGDPNIVNDKGLLTVNAFDGKGICYIVRASGKVVMSVGSPREKNEDVEPISNYLDFLGNPIKVKLDGTTIKKIENDFDAEQQARDTFLFYDKEMRIEYYLTYQPIGFDDWMFVGLVPSKIVNSSMNEFRTQIMLTMALLFLVITIVIVFVIVLLIRTKSKENERKSKQEIKTRDALFDLLTYNSNDLFVLFSPDTFKAQYVSSNIPQVLGLDIDEIKKDVHTVLNASLNAHAAFTSEGLKTLPQGRTWDTDIQMQNVKTEEKYWCHMSLYRSKYNDEDSFILMLSDRTNEHSMSESLEEALQLAKSANEAKSNFLANMSHDIRTPMNAIVGFATLLAKDADKPEKVREYVRKISFSSHHLLSLINDILDMSKIESGKTTLNAADFDLSELLEELYTMMAPQAKARKQEFIITTKGKLPETVNADRLRINQVLINLISNAIKYTPDQGHIELNVEALESNISGHAHVRIIVKDDGIGMSEEFTKEIFEPFAREVTAKNKGVQGTGLGMAITKNIVDLMGGTISVESEIDKGSTFILELELLIAGKAIADEPEFWKKHNIVRILVVDNDEDICLNIQDLMEDTGVDVNYATSGMQAIEMVDEAYHGKKDYNIILIDWKMPKMDGIKTAKEIRKKVGKDIPIMILTSYNFDEIEEEAKAAGIDLFLPKPFFVSNFRNALEKLTSGEKLETEVKVEDISLKGLKVLAAEDNEINAEILVDLLEMEDVECEIACNGLEALEKFETSDPGRYDLIFMDVQMPVMNGYEATLAIRKCKHPEAKKIPIIAMTANAFEDDIKEALDSGMNAHLAKPVDMNKLKLIVDNLRKKNSKK